MQFLNLGCGQKYVRKPEWLNADMLPIDKAVIKCNFLNGIPFGDNQFDLVYHSHVLEHFAKSDGEKFLTECYRIIKPNGALRIALPNLEVIAKQYLTNLDRAFAGEHNANNDYDWILLEMYDQTVRNTYGGNMLEYLTRKQMDNSEYVFNRIGEGGKIWREAIMGLQNGSTPKDSKLQKIVKDPTLVFKGLKDLYLRVVLSKKDYTFYNTGKFRFGGEIHQWMYDKYSLTRLLTEIGFKDVVVRSATDSYIANWGDYQLDDRTETASLFIEAIK